MEKLLLGFLLLISYAKSQPICFNLAGMHSVGNVPVTLTIGDFNNDGKKDIATANQGSNSISILLGLGNGNFSAATHFTVGNGPSGITSADFNNDGNMDIATSNQNANTVSVRMGLGNGSFSAPVNYATGSMPLRIISTDFNNDSRPDLAVTCYNSNNVSILLCSATGTFSSAGNFSVGNSPHSLAFGDFNADGKKDIAVSHFISTFVSVLLGNGTGGFAGASNYAIGFNNGTSVVCKDMDADNKTDILVSTTGRISFFKGTGAGTFSPAIHAIASNQPYDMEVRDFNNDGFDDLVHSTGSIHFNTYTISPTVAFTPMGTYTVTTPGDDYYSVESDDFNNDGKYDLAITNYSFGKVTIFLNGLPNVSVVSSASVTCIGSAVTLSASGATSYSWSNGATTNSISVSPTVSTTYTLTGNTLNGCSNTNSITINIDTPTISVNSGTICNGQSFTITPSGAVSYTYPGGSNVVSPSSNQSYSITGSSTNGCIASAISNVTVNALPSLSITPANTLICTGQTTSLTASGAATYTWSTNSASNSISISPATTTTYTVTGSAVNGCTNSASFTQSVSACTGITNQTAIQSNDLVVYPNPTNDVAYLTLNKVSTITVFNMMGETVLTIETVNGVQRIDLSRLPDGFYFIRTEDGVIQLSAKVLKQ